ncbi:hypothetical protein DESC_60025 [Desulfosarcina cetonica]|nr:hypothetical protein DESC_60025 [Desulfosarcina cetonica]
MDHDGLDAGGLENLAGAAGRVVIGARLADTDGTGTDDENFLLGGRGHGISLNPDTNFDGFRSLWCQMTTADGVFDQLASKVPQVGRARLDPLIALHDLGLDDAVALPHLSLGKGIVNQRLQAVEGVGEARLGGFTGFELIPQGTKCLGLVPGQQIEDAFGRGRFALGLVLVSDAVVAIGIAGIDLHQIVDQHHADHLQKIDRVIGLGVLTQHQGHQGQVPGVLGIVLLA